MKAIVLLRVMFGIVLLRVIAEGDVWDCIAEGDVWDCIAEGDVWELWSGELFRTLRSLSSWPSRLLMSDNVATITLNKTTLLS